MRDQRALLRHRVALIQVATSLRNRVHAVLADRGIRVQERPWSIAGRAWLASLALPPVARAVVDDCLALIDALDPIVARLERDLRARAKPDPRVTALQVLPGVGQITAMTLVAEIGDVTRFATARKLCAWAGLTPQVRNSDRTVRHGHSTKQGSAAVRWVLTEAAQRAKTQPPFTRFYADCARRRGKQVATVAVARKLLARCFHVLNQVHAATTTSAEGQPAGCAR